jgi:hypothetical protein
MTSRRNAPKSSRWKRAARYSAYFSIVAAVLAAFRYYMLSNKPAIPSSAQDNAYFMEQMDSLHRADYSSFYFLCGFAAVNFCLFLVSRYMTKKELE